MLKPDKLKKSVVPSIWCMNSTTKPDFVEQMVSAISLGIFQKQDTDNTIVMDRDPKPVGNLSAQIRVERSV
jgi:hypothetical protein